VNIDVPDIPRGVFERIEAVAGALPETTLRSDKTAHAFEIRRKPFAWLFRVEGVIGLVVDVDFDERRALLERGHPYFEAGLARRIGIVIDDDADWDEIAELVTESYRLVAPKKLSALLD
jgi:predicted DNA-binding protein (MmcQ/YjbR family)